MKRRDLLKSAPAFGGLAFLPGFASAAQPVPLSSNIESSLSAFRLAVAKFDAMKAYMATSAATYDEIRPSIEPVRSFDYRRLEKDGYRGQGYLAEQLTDAYGKSVWDGNTPVFIVYSAHLKNEIGYFGDGRLTVVKMLQRRLDAAIAYEAAEKDARVTSNLNDATEALYWAEDDLRKTMQALIDVGSTTGADVVAKADARIAFYERMPSMTNSHYDRKIMAEVVSLLGARK